LNEAHLFQSVDTYVLQPVIAQPMMIECISRVPSQENGTGEIIAQGGLRHVGLSPLQRLCWRKKVRVESARHRATTCRCRHRGKGLVTGRPHAGAGIGAKAPSPGDHKGRPYYATASHAGAGIGAKERFFPFTLFPGEYHLS